MPENLMTHFDHHDQELAADPFPTYEALRQKCPVAHSENYGGFWALSRYEDVYNAAHDPATFSSARRGVTIPHMGAEGAPPMIPIEIDPPMHVKYRQITQRLFSPGYLEANWAERIRTVTNECIDALAGRGEADFAEGLCVPIPLTVITQMMDVPPADREQFKDWSAKLVQLHHLSPEVQMETAMALMGYFGAQAADRREHPRDDLVTVVVQGEVDGRPLTDLEVQQYCFLLLLAGNETTTNAMGAALWYLGEHPEARKRLADDPSLIPTAVEEFLRYFSPVQGLARTTTTSVDVGGTMIPADEPVLLLWASANRDEEQFPRACEFILDRSPNLHIAFGAGPHRCLGSSLARLELRILLEQVLQRIPDYEVAGPVEWYMGATRAISRLPVRYPVVSPVP